MVQDDNSQEIQITSSAEALTYLESFSLNKTNLRFRGQADYDWLLQPSVYRFNGFKRYQTVFYEDYLLFRGFKNRQNFLFKEYLKRAEPREPTLPFAYTKYDLEWLMLCQHYGLPTRLLDWTTEIMVALFFSCHSKKDAKKDGALFVCDSNDYPLFAADDLSARNTQDLAFVNVSTNINNSRLKAQSGCFMIWGHAPLDDTSKESYHLDQYHEHNNVIPPQTKLRIPKESKGQILQELKERYSITHDNLQLNHNPFEVSLRRMKDDARLVTLHLTDWDKLSSKQKRLSDEMFRVKCKNAFGECLSLTQTSFYLGFLR